MSLNVCTTVSGTDSLKVLRQNVRIARAFSPMTAKERRLYEQNVSTDATDGRFELYKTTADHEGPGRPCAAWVSVPGRGCPVMILASGF